MEKMNIDKIINNSKSMNMYEIDEENGKIFVRDKEKVLCDIRGQFEYLCNNMIVTTNFPHVFPLEVECGTAINFYGVKEPFMRFSYRKMVNGKIEQVTKFYVSFFTKLREYAVDPNDRSKGTKKYLKEYVYIQNGSETAEPKLFREYYSASMNMIEEIFYLAITFYDTRAGAAILPDGVEYLNGLDQLPPDLKNALSDLKHTANGCLIEMFDTSNSPEFENDSVSLDLETLVKRKLSKSQLN